MFGRRHGGARGGDAASANSGRSGRSGGYSASAGSGAEQSSIQLDETSACTSWTEDGEEDGTRSAFVAATNPAPAVLAADKGECRAPAAREDAQHAARQGTGGRESARRPHPGARSTPRPSCGPAARRVSGRRQSARGCECEQQPGAVWGARRRPGGAQRQRTQHQRPGRRSRRTSTPLRTTETRCAGLSRATTRMTTGRSASSSRPVA